MFSGPISHITGSGLMYSILYECVLMTEDWLFAEASAVSGQLVVDEEPSWKESVVVGSDPQAVVVLVQEPVPPLQDPVSSFPMQLPGMD